MVTLTVWFVIVFVKLTNLYIIFTTKILEIYFEQYSHAPINTSEVARNNCIKNCLLRVMICTVFYIY